MVLNAARQYKRSGCATQRSITVENRRYDVSRIIKICTALPGRADGFDLLHYDVDRVYQNLCRRVSQLPQERGQPADLTVRSAG